MTLALSGASMTLYDLKLYMGQRLDGAPGKNGTAYGPHAGITAIAQARCVRLPERA